MKFYNRIGELSELQRIQNLSLLSVNTQYWQKKEAILPGMRYMIIFSDRDQKLYRVTIYYKIRLPDLFRCHVGKVFQTTIC